MFIHVYFMVVGKGKMIISHPLYTALSACRYNLSHIKERQSTVYYLDFVLKLTEFES